MKPSRALQMSTYVAASRSAAAWARAKLAELNERSADPADTVPDWPLWIILALLLAIGGVVTTYSLCSKITPVPPVAHERSHP